MNKIMLIIFSLVLAFQSILIYPLYAYREFLSTNVNNVINEKEELVFFIDNFEKVFLDYCDILRKNGLDIDYSQIQPQLNNIKDILQANQPINNILNDFYNNFVNTLTTFITNPFTGAITGGIIGPILGTLLGGGIVLAIDAGISLVEIVVLAFFGTVLFGFAGLLVGGLAGFVLSIIIVIIEAIFFAIIGASAGALLSLAIPIPIIIDLILAVVILGGFGFVFGGLGGLINLVILVPITAILGAIVGSAMGLLLGSFAGLGFVVGIEQLIFLPLALLVAAIGAVLGIFAGPTAGALAGLFLPNTSTAGENQSAGDDGQVATTQPVPTRLGIPPNIDNLTPTTPVLPPLTYSPFTTQAKLLTFLRKTEEIFYSNDKKIFTDLKGTLEPVLDNYNKIFGKNKTKNITVKISNILNKADLTTPEGINEATAKILYLIPDTQNNY